MTGVDCKTNVRWVGTVTILAAMAVSSGSDSDVGEAILRRACQRVGDTKSLGGDVEGDLRSPPKRVRVISRVGSDSSIVVGDRGDGSPVPPCGNASKKRSRGGDDDD